MNQTLKRKQILCKCIALSLLIHAGVAVLLQHHAIWLYSPTSTKTSPTTVWLASMSKQEQTDILRSALCSQHPTRSQEIGTKPLSEKGQLAFRTTVPDPSYLSSYQSLASPPPFDPDHLLVSHAEKLPTFTLPLQELFNLPSHIPKDLIQPTEEKTVDFAAPSPPAFHPEETIAFQPVASQLKLSQQLPEVAYAEPTEQVSPFSRPSPTAPALRPSWFHTLPQLPTLEELDTTSYSEEFDTDLVFMPREDGPGYLFALTLIPKIDLHIPKLKQHYMFLIDRANSIQKERLFQTKSAVYKAIEELGPDDTFNITVFDSKMEKLFPTQRPLNRSSLAAAKEFIQKIELGSFFSPADLYKPLLITVPSYVQEDEIYTAILLTDGDTLVKKNAGLALLQEWSYYNQGKVALYALGMTGDKQTSSLEAICSFNRGQAMQSATKRGLKRKLLRLMKTIQTPIVKNISCHAFSRSPHTAIKLYPDNTRTHHLYAGQPYTIIGTAETLDDFVLFIQGRIKDRWLNIKKTVSFISAKKGDSSLEAQWTWQKAYDLYGQYLQDKNAKHLAEMRQLITPLQLPPAFQ
ncbi:MAG TPA: hypothetical protein DCE71_07550 [Parachlamydiales bacterium]|nr:hypothetical protein [Parachlamydiales bacterium]